MHSRIHRDRPGNGWRPRHRHGHGDSPISTLTRIAVAGTLLSLANLPTSCAHAGILFDADVDEEIPVMTAANQLERRLNRRGEALWKIPLGPALVESMRWIDDDLIYVALRLDSEKLSNLDHMLVDATSGEIRWRQSRDGADDRYAMLYGTDDVLLFTVTDKRNRRRLLALDTSTGHERWSIEQKPAKKSPHVPPTIVASAGLVIAVDKRRRESRALAIDSGAVMWSRAFSDDRSDTHRWLTNGTRLWQAAESLVEVAAGDGQTLARAGEVRVSAHTAAQFDNDEWLIVDPDGLVHNVAAEDMSRKWQYSPPTGLTVSNVYPFDERVYIRAHTTGTSSAGRAHRLTALNRADGRAIWHHDTVDASLSNLLHVEDAVFHATGSTVYRLNRTTGQQQYATRVTDTGRSFPVRLRELDGHIAYIGELVIAGVETQSGELKYRHGMTPIASDTSLNAVEASIPRLRAQMGAPAGASFQLGQSRQFQNMSNNYHRQAQSYRTQAFMARSAGMEGMADSADFRSMEAIGAANRASNQARTMAAVEMSLSVMNLAMQLNEMWRVAGIQATIDRHELFRSSILANYTVAENYRYVFRPHSRYRAADDHFVGVEVVNLETGGSRFHYLSPSYRAYGLWNLVDFESGTIIHHGVGLESADYSYSKPRKNSAMAPKMQTVEGFLMAVPARMP